MLTPVYTDPVTIAIGFLACVGALSLIGLIWLLLLVTAESYGYARTGGNPGHDPMTRDDAYRAQRLQSLYDMQAMYRESLRNAPIEDKEPS